MELAGSTHNIIFTMLPYFNNIEQFHTTSNQSRQLIFSSYCPRLRACLCSLRQKSYRYFFVNNFSLKCSSGFLSSAVGDVSSSTSSAPWMMSQSVKSSSARSSIHCSASWNICLRLFADLLSCILRKFFNPTSERPARYSTTTLMDGGSDAIRPAHLSLRRRMVRSTAVDMAVND